MATVAVHVRTSHRLSTVVATLITALLIIVATVTFGIARNGAGARGFGATSAADRVSTPTSACVFRHHGWFC
jgi:hypothetical protein